MGLIILDTSCKWNHVVDFFLNYYMLTHKFTETGERVGLAQCLHTSFLTDVVTDRTQWKQEKISDPWARLMEKGKNIIFKTSRLTPNVREIWEKKLVQNRQGRLLSLHLIDSMILLEFFFSIPGESWISLRRLIVKLLPSAYIAPSECGFWAVRSRGRRGRRWPNPSLTSCVDGFSLAVEVTQGGCCLGCLSLCLKSCRLHLLAEAGLTSAQVTGFPFIIKIIMERVKRQWLGHRSRDYMAGKHS